MHIGSFYRRGYLIEPYNTELAQPDRDIKFCDDYIKPQGLVGKYAIPLRIGLGMGIAFEEVQQPEDCESPEATDVIVAEENYIFFWEGRGDMKNWTNIKMSLKKMKEPWYQVE